MSKSRTGQAGYTECIELLQAQATLALENAESEWMAHLQSADTESDTSPAEAETRLLQSSGVAYREFRDRHCEFASMELDSVTEPTASGSVQNIDGSLAR